MSPLADQLAALGLHHTGAHLDDLVALATKKRWSATQLLEHLDVGDHPAHARRRGLRIPLPRLQLPHPERDPRAVVVENGHLALGIVARRRHPIDPIVGPERLPVVVPTLVGESRLAIEEGGDLLEQAHDSAMSAR